MAVNDVSSLQISREHLSAFLELASDYQTCRDVESLLKTLLLHTVTQLDAEAAFLWSPEAHGGGLVCSQRCYAAEVRFEPAAEPVTDG